MKKIFILILAVTFTACNAPAEQVGAGFFVPQPGEKFVVATDEVNDVWVKYIEAHNNRDLDAIASMNIDSTQQMGSFKIIGPDGSLIDGTDTHIEFLKGWFEAENPTWNTFFSYTMKVENQPGEWVISGAQVKKTVNGEEVTSYDVIDAYIEEGKIGAFWVYTRAEGSQE